MLDYVSLDGDYIHNDNDPSLRRGVTQADALTGITSVRGSIIPRPLGHGGIEPVKKYQSERLITIEGQVWGDIAGHPDDTASINSAWEEWHAFAATIIPALDRDVVLQWRQSGGSVDKTATVRLAGECQPTLSSDDNGPFIAYQLHLSAGDPTYTSTVLKSASVAPPTSTGSLVFPLVFPLSFGSGGSGGDVIIANDGNAESWPTFTITGPVAAPAIESVNRGVGLYFDGLSLATGQTLVIVTKPGQRSIRVNGFDARGAIRWGTSRYFPVSAKAAETLKFFGQGGGYAPTTNLRVDWRDTYVT